eukprot:5527406-Amphidinium_carterae.2
MEVDALSCRALPLDANPANTVQCVRLLQSDRAKEFVNSRLHGYDPANNCTVERAVASALRRVLAATKYSHESWCYFLQYVDQCFLHSAMSMKQVQPPVGSLLVARIICWGGGLDMRGTIGSVLFLDHRHKGDDTSFILAGDEADMAEVLSLGPKMWKAYFMP